MRNLKYTLILGVILFAACDAGHVKDYYVDNKLTHSIHVIYTSRMEEDTVMVEADENKLIFKDEYPFGHVGVSDDREYDHIENIRIQTDDTLVSVDESKWIYEKLEKYHAEYTMIIDSTMVE